MLLVPVAPNEGTGTDPSVGVAPAPGDPGTADAETEVGAAALSPEPFPPLSAVVARPITPATMPTPISAKPPIRNGDPPDDPGVVTTTSESAGAGR
jgi:hypothetical protein